jgi:PleD family two-component response regulator
LKTEEMDWSMSLMTADLQQDGPESHLHPDELFILRKKRVLVIEEDWDFSQLLSDLIAQHLDVEVEVVKNPYQALSRMIHEPFDVLVLDSLWNPYQALTEAEQFLEPLIQNSLTTLHKVPVLVVTSELDPAIRGLESQYFRIIAAIERSGELRTTVKQIEEELNEILDM